MIAGRERSAISNFSLDTRRLSNKGSVNKWSAGVFDGLRIPTGKSFRCALFLNSIAKSPTVSFRRSAVDCWLLASRSLRPPTRLAAAEGGGGGGGGAGSGGGALNQGQPRVEVPSDLTVCKPGQVWDTKRRKCLVRRSDVLPDPVMTEYAYALAKADRYQEAIDVLDLLDNPNTPRALNLSAAPRDPQAWMHRQRALAIISSQVALAPRAYPQVREYLGEAYVIEGKYDLAKEQLSMIERLCSKNCEYYEDLADALTEAHALEVWGLSDARRRSRRCTSCMRQREA